jgi:hypothetical protein
LWVKKESFGIERVYPDCYYWFCIGGIKSIINLQVCDFEVRVGLRLVRGAILVTVLVLNLFFLDMKWINTGHEDCLL